MLIATFKAILSAVRTTAEVIDVNVDTLYHVSSVANDQAQIYRATNFKEAKEEFKDLQAELNTLAMQREQRRADLLKKVRPSNSNQQPTQQTQQLSAPAEK